MSRDFLVVLGNSRLYPLTDRLISGLSHAEQVMRLAERGVTLVQLREKVLSARDFYVEASAAMSVARGFGISIIINDRVDVALAVQADGVHLGQDDMSPEAARRVLGPEALIGISTHNPAQAKRAAAMPVNYVAIGPIFPTVTKDTLNPPVGLHRLREVCQSLANMPVIAIGGITLDKSEEVIGAGAVGIALIRDLWI